MGSGLHVHDGLSFCSPALCCKECSSSLASSITGYSLGHETALVGPSGSPQPRGQLVEYIVSTPLGSFPPHVNPLVTPLSGMAEAGPDPRFIRYVMRGMLREIDRFSVGALARQATLEVASWSTSTP